MADVTVRLFWELDGKTGSHEVPVDDDMEIGTFVYLWLDGGNMSCDCNMSQAFGLPKMECGTRIKIERVEIVNW